jgi:hypothetical protein
MQYMLLIYNDEQAWASQSDEERNAIFGEYYEFSEAIADKTLHGAPLHATSDSTTVRVRNGETLVTDGPFAETKEQLGGFYMIEADSLDEALDIAARVPGAKYGSIEVRPVMQVPARQT